MVDKLDNDNPGLYVSGGHEYAKKNGSAYNSNGSSSLYSKAAGAAKTLANGDGSVDVGRTPEYFNGAAKSERVWAPRWRPTYNGMRMLRMPAMHADAVDMRIV